MAPALIVSWRESVTDRGRRGTAGTETGTGENEGRGKDGDPVVQTGTRNDVNAEEVVAAAGNEGANAGRRKEMGMTGAERRTGIIIKIEALRGRGRGIRRAGPRMMSGGIKTTEKGTGKKGRPKGRAGVEAEKGGTKVGERRRARKESAATAERGIERGMENVTNIVVVKRGAIISESPVTTTVNIANAEGV